MRVDEATASPGTRSTPARSRLERAAKGRLEQAREQIPLLPQFGHLLIETVDESPVRLARFGFGLDVLCGEAPLRNRSLAAPHGSAEPEAGGVRRRGVRCS